MPPGTIAPDLLIDLYELTMGESYLAEGMAETPATFEVTCRHLPQGWGYLVSAGIDSLLDALEAFRFDEAASTFLADTGLFGTRFLELLGGLRFSGQVRALPEGTIWSAGEPLVEVTAPLLQAQLVETTVLNRVGFSSLVTAKASRCVEAAAGRTLVEFGLRRTQGADAGMVASRGSYLAGFSSTSNVLAGERYGIPVSGTMAHSYVQAFADEEAAFEAFTRTHPAGATLLLDTYDTIEGARRAVAVGQRLRDRGGALAGVRLDSGELLEQSVRVRAVLDAAGLDEVAIIASGNLDEFAIAELVAAAAPIDGFGVGTRVGVSVDAPALDVAYKLVALDGRPVMKLSPGKSTMPGSKQVWRRREGGEFAGDVVSLHDEPPPSDEAEALLETAMEHGRRTSSETLEAARKRLKAQRGALPAHHRRLDAGPYPVAASDALSALTGSISAALRQASHEGAESPYTDT